MAKANAKSQAVAVEATKGTLVALASEAVELSRLLMESGGELTPELEKRLEVVAQALPAKVDSYKYVIDEFEAQAALWKRRKDAAAAIQKRFEAQVDSLNERIKFAMKELGTKEVAGNLYKFQLRNSTPRMVIDDENAIPAQFKMIVQTTAIDKDKLKMVLTEGFEVPGAKLEESQALYTLDSPGKE